MFVDACAIIAVIMREDEAQAYSNALIDAPASFTSALAAWEATIILARADRLDCGYAEAAGTVLDWLKGWGVELREPGSSHEILAHAVSVAEHHGIGKRTLSNFDCFHYAHAKAAGVPLLTLDRLLRQTDVETRP